MVNELLRQYIQALLETDELREFCSLGGGMIQGYTLPLGMKPVHPKPLPLRKRKKKTNKSKSTK